jgi:hypothetical protein
MSMGELPTTNKMSMGEGFASYGSREVVKSTAIAQFKIVESCNF